MENLIFSFNAVIPLFMVVALGWLIRRWGWLSGDTAQKLNNLCFRVLIPCNLFITARNADLRTAFDPALIGFAALAFLLTVAVLWLVVPRWIAARSSAGAWIQGAFRSNAVLFGLPLAVNLFGVTGAVPMALLVSMMVPLFNVLAALVLTAFSSTGKGKVSPSALLHNVVSNPLILAALLGILCSYFDLSLPILLSKPITDLGMAGTPLAMLALGAQFDWGNAAGQLRLSLPAVCVKLVVLPLLWTPIAYAVGFRGATLGALFITFAAPTAVSSVAMCESMGCDGALAGEIVLFDTALSALTIFLGTALMRTCGLF